LNNADQQLPETSALMIWVKKNGAQIMILRSLLQEQRTCWSTIQVDELKLFDGSGIE
jgi:hypothetical protein